MRLNGLMNLAISSKNVYSPACRQMIVCGRVTFKGVTSN